MKIYFPEIGEYGLVAYAVKIVSLLFSPERNDQI